jgi:hypothetical protein
MAFQEPDHLFVSGLAIPELIGFKLDLQKQRRNEGAFSAAQDPKPRALGINPQRLAGIKKLSSLQERIGRVTGTKTVSESIWSVRCSSELAPASQDGFSADGV